MARKTGEQNNEDRKKNITKKAKPVNKAKRKTKEKLIPRKVSINNIKERYITHDGQKLTTLQAKFVNLYIELGNQRQAVIQAGFKCKNADVQANKLLRVPKIASEINWRMAQLTKDSIASADEILQYYTKVMRGEEKDQFGLEAPLSERTKAASELAKRLVDIPNKLEGKAQAQVTISLDFSGMEEDTNDDTNQ